MTHGVGLTWIVNYIHYSVGLLTHSQTSSWEWNCVISSHTLLDMWLLIRSMLGLKVVPEPRQGDPVDLRPKLSFHLDWQHCDVGPASALVCIVVFSSRHRANVGIPSPALLQYVNILSERGGWRIVVCRRFLSGLWWLKLSVFSYKCCRSTRLSMPQLHI